ncbi:hypothetical protein [Ferdinandcohnia sp. Marseille-Q9671]
MTTICIDESGNFENKSKTLLIGGLIYHGEDHEEESLRIEQFFKKQCRAIGLDYPKGIHVHDRKASAEQIEKKRQLKEKVKEYIKSSKQYQFVCMIRPHHFKSTAASNLLNDDIASNLYENMISQFLTTYLFSNPYRVNSGLTRLEIAKRSFPVKFSDKQRIEEYDSLGYDYKDLHGEGKRRYFITNQATFKTMLTSQMGENVEDHFHLNVESINYHLTKRDRVERKTTPFLYFADFACDIIRETVGSPTYKGYENPDFNIMKFYEVSKRITGRPVLFWAYDEINKLWRSLYKAFQEKDVISYFSLLFTLKKSTSPFEPYYSMFWVPTLHNQKELAFDENLFYKYVEDFKDYVDKQRNSKKTEDLHEAVFIGDQMWDLVEAWEAKRKMVNHQQHKLLLATSLVLVNNHLGNIKRSKFYLDKINELQAFASLEDLCGIVIITAMRYVNCFQFNDALELLNRNVATLENMKQLTMSNASLFNPSSDPVEYKSGLLGKTNSALAQVYSYLGEKDLSQLYFEEALKEFEKDPDNREFTISCFLHMAIDKKDKGLFDTYVGEYLSSVFVQEQLDYIRKLDSLRKNSFKVYCFVKSLTSFNHTLTKQEKMNVAKFLHDLLTKGDTKDVHPWELIYKHAAIWLQKHSKKEIDIDPLLALIRSTAEGDAQLTVKLINLDTEIQLSLLYGRTYEDIRPLLNYFKELVVRDDEVADYFEGLLELDSLEDQCRFIHQKFTYLYT